MDLMNLKPATQKVDVRHPATGSPTGLIIEVTSAEADAVKGVQRRQIDKALRSRSKKMTAAEIETNNTERTVACVVGWEWKGSASWGGKKLDFSKENVAAVLEVAWVRSQVEEAIADEAGFFSS